MARIVIQGSRLRVRSGPGLSYPVVGYRNNGDYVEIKEQNQGWIRIGDGQWVSGEYVNNDAEHGTLNEEGDVIPHPGRPNSRHWRLLVGFATNSAELRSAHRRWLQGFAASQARSGPFVWIRGMASRLGNPGTNQALSEWRAQAVRDFLVNRCRVPGNRVTGISGVGESRARGSETDNSSRWRAAEVIITNNVIELPGSFISGATPISTEFWIKYMGSSTGGEVVAGDYAQFIIRTRTNHWQRYFYVGGGLGAGSPVNFGDALPSGQGWVRFTTRSPVSVAAFDGLAGVSQVGLQVGGGYSRFNLVLRNTDDHLIVPTGSGLSVGLSATGGWMDTAGEIEYSSLWEYY